MAAINGPTGPKVPPFNLVKPMPEELPENVQTGERPPATAQKLTTDISTQPRVEDPLAKTMAKLYWKKDGSFGKGNVTKTVKATNPVAVGAKLGVNGKGDDVKVKRELGSSEGYDSKWQAVAVARLGGAEPAVVVQVGKKWHALETTASIDGKFQAADSSQMMQ